MYQLTRSRADRTISRIIHPQTWQSKTWSKYGGVTKTRNSLISEEKKKLKPTLGSGAWLVDAWKLRFSAEKNILTMLQTSRKLVALFVPTGRPRTGTQMMIRHSPIAQRIVKMPMCFTKMRIGTKSTTACLEARLKRPSAPTTLIGLLSRGTAMIHPYRMEREESSSWARGRLDLR